MPTQFPSRFDLAAEALLQDQRLNQEARSVYRMLQLMYAKSQATSWPRPQTLASALGSNTRAVRNALARLADLGYLERKPATRNNRVGYRFPRIEDGLLLSGLAAVRYARQAKYQHAVGILPTLPDPRHSRLHCACRSRLEAGRSICTPDAVLALKTQRRQLRPETGQE